MAKFYITTAIDYVNAKPHIGHAIEKIQADVLARFHRQKGDDVWFLTGTDEHGAKIARAAQAAGKDPKDFVDDGAGHFKDLKKALNLSWDDFIRTSDQKRHWPGAQKLWLKLFEAGDLYKKNYKGLYCVGHEAFVTEKDLVGGKCRDHQTAPELIEEENWFFRLSKYSDRINSAIESGELKIVPESRKNEILSLIRQGLEDVSFSRPRKDLSWGIPVPNDPEHTMYVWCDALTNYITAIGYGEENSKFKNQNSKFWKWWPADLHVIGKDILRFHAAIWPGMLLAAGLPLSKAIFVHGFITVEGQKMSKTIGNVIDPMEIVNKYGTDALRYYLLREIPAYEDGDFSVAKFEERYSADLVHGLGNLVARVLALAKKSDVVEKETFKKEIEQAKEKIEKLIAEFRFNDALAAIWQLIFLGDKYIDGKKPWTLKPESAEFQEIIGSLLFLISEIGKLLEPFLPETSEKIAEQLKTNESKILFPKLS